VGHASWDRLCPVFLEACKQLEAFDPEHMYKYFPSQDAWTWEQEATEWDAKVWDSNEMHVSYNLEDEDGAWPSRHNWVHINDGHVHGAAEKPPYIAPMGQWVRDGGWPSREDCRGLTSPTNTGTLDQSGLHAAGRQQRLDDFPLIASSDNTQLHANVASPCQSQPLTTPLQTEQQNW